MQNFVKVYEIFIMLCIMIISSHLIVNKLLIIGKFYRYMPVIFIAIKNILLTLILLKL